MIPVTILRDNREQKPWEFEEFDVSVEDVTLTTGDYSIAELCSHDEDVDTYYPHYAVERKSGSDFLRSVTRDRERFKQEIKRASEWECPLRVFVEAPRTRKRYQEDYFLDHFNGTRSQVFGTVDTWERAYNVSFTFAGTRANAERKAFSALVSQLRASLTSSD